MEKLYLKYEESSHGGQLYPDEPEEWGNHKPEYVYWRPIALTKNKPSGIFCETIELDKIQEKHYLVVVRYETGNSFGTSHGNYTIIKLCDNYEYASRIKEYIQYDNEVYYANENQFSEKIKDERKEKFPDIYGMFYNEGNSDLMYKKWLGYFEKLEDVEIHEMKVTLT